MADDAFADLDYPDAPPTAPEDNFGPRAASDVISNRKLAVNAGMEQDPEDAAEALRLQNLTSVPAEMIMADQDGFKDNLRRSSAQQIVMNNPALSDYVESHALASVISADDWGNLDEYTGHASGLQKTLDLLSDAANPEEWKSFGTGLAQGLIPTAGALAGAGYAGTTLATWGSAFGPAGTFAGGLTGMILGGLAGGWGADELQSHIINDALPTAWSAGINQATQSAEEAHPLAFFAGEMLPNMLVAKPNLRNFLIVDRLLGATFMGGGEAAQEAYQGHGFDPERIGIAAGVGALSPGLNFVGEKLEQAGSGLAPKPKPGPEKEGITAEPEPTVPPPASAQEKKAAEALQAARLWMENGEDVPAGVHQEVDKAKADMNSDGVKQLLAALAAREKTETYQRSPEMFDRLAEQQHSGSTVGIAGEAAVKLYGDKPVEAGDGLLSWVPNIEAQLAQARDGGSDVEVPVRDLLAKADPEVIKGLKDDIRTWPGGITAREAKEPIEPAPTLPAALARVRAAAGLEPKFSIGDRPVEVAPEDMDVESFMRDFTNAAIRASSVDVLDSEEAWSAGSRAVDTGGDAYQAFADEVNRRWRDAGVDRVFSRDEAVEHVTRNDRYGSITGIPMNVPESERILPEAFSTEPQLEKSRRDRESLRGLTLQEDVKYRNRANSGSDNPTYHKFRFIDKDGKDVGYITLNSSDPKGEKALWVEMVEGEIANTINGFGPALVIAVKGQIKQLMPEFDYISGYRVSGARNGKAAREGLTGEQMVAKVKLSVDGPPTLEDHQTFLDLLATPNWVDVLHGVQVDVRGPEKFTPERRELNRIIREEAARIISDKATVTPVAGVRFKNVQAGGVYFGENARAIFYDLLGNDPQGAVRHEAIHALREFFTDQEWNELERRSMDEDWQGRFDIERKYPWLDGTGKLEESIAEGFREWAAQEETIRPRTGIGAIFQKLKDFIDRVRQRLVEVLGRDPTAEEVFGRVRSGEVGARGEVRINADGRAMFAVKGGVGSAPEFPVGKVNITDKEWLGFHGTVAKPFDRFLFRRSRPGDKTFGGVYFSPDPNYASEYAHYTQPNARVYASRITPGKTRLFDMNNYRDDPDFFESGKKFLKEYAVSRNYTKGQAEYKRKLYLDGNALAIFHFLIRLTENIALRDNLDTMVFRMPPYHDRGLDQIVVLNPAMIRPAWEGIQKKSTQPKFSVSDEAGAELPPPSRPDLSTLPPDPRQPMRLTPPPVSMAKQTFGPYEKALEAQHAADIALARKRFEAQERKRQTKEWKEAEVHTRAEVAAEVNKRPAIALDQFLGAGRVDGRKVGDHFSIKAGDLTPEQQAAIPKRFYTEKGIPIDDLVNALGFKSRQDLVDGLAGVQAAKIGPNGKPVRTDDLVRDLIRKETARRMEAEHGKLEENIAAAATKHALSTPSLDLVYEQFKKAAEAVGKPVVDKEVIQEAAKRMVGANTVKKANSYRLMQDMAGWARKAEAALATGDAIGAAEPLQKQTLLAYAAREAHDFEQLVAKNEKLAKRMVKRDQPTMPPAYTNWLHYVMGKVGYKIQRTPEDLARELEQYRGTFENFVNHARADGQPMLGVWDRFYDPNWSVKDRMQMTADEYRRVAETMQELVENGREENRLIGRQGAIEFKTKVVGEMVASMADMKPLPESFSGQQPGFLKGLGARLQQVEYVFNRWDRGDWLGPWQQYLFRPLVEGANQVDKWAKEMSREITAIQKRPLLTKAIPNDLIMNPRTRQFYSMNQENLRVIMQNMGNRSNAVKFVKGWSIKAPDFEHKITVRDTLNFIDKHATQEDWDAVQAVWRALEKPREWWENMYRGIEEIPPERVEPWQIPTRFGPQQGGYFPVIPHPEFKGDPSKFDRLGDGALFEDTASDGWMPASGYTNERTGWKGPMDLTYDQLPNRIMQQIRDAALRPGLMNASKILRDSDIRRTIESRAGVQYYQMLEDYLRMVANADARNAAKSPWLRKAAGYLNYIRENMISSLIGLNWHTVVKHFTSTLALAVNDVGAGYMGEAAKRMFDTDPETGEAWHQFAHENSLELQRRDRSNREQLYGASSEMAGRTNAYTSMREKLMTWGAKPVTLSDLAVSYPNWLAAYARALHENPNISHGDAVYYAERAIRRSHGSSAITSTAMIQHDVGPMFGSFYNFFSDMVNRVNENAWKAGQARLAYKAGDMPKAKKLAVGAVAGMFFASVIPAIFENLVSPLPSSPGDSTAKKLAKGAVHFAAAGVPVVRDFVGYIMDSTEPAVGLYTEGFKSVGEFVQDLENKHATNPVRLEKAIRDFGGLVGTAVGGPMAEAGRIGSAGYGLVKGIEHPQGFGDWLDLYGKGTMRERYRRK